ncbi:hypothetical protein WDU94_001811 [Cyamophila willieti]
MKKYVDWVLKHRDKVVEKTDRNLFATGQGRHLSGIDQIRNITAHLNIESNMTSTVKAIERVEKGDKKSDVAKDFNIPLNTLSGIVKNKDKICAAKSSKGSMRISKGEFPHLEANLVTWLQQCRGQNVPVSGILMKEKAKVFAKNLGIKDFLASEGWLTNFKKRNDIVFKKVCGESGSVDNTVCSEWQRELQVLVKDRDPKDIFNTDETGLFFKCLPDKTLTFKDEKCHGGKHSKERLTILLATNMDGSEKLKPFVIGKSVKPRCFKGIQSLPTTYRANKKAWMTTELFNEWLSSINTDMKKKNRHILLFMDNCTVHNNAPILSNITIHFFPPNTTSKLQPLDQGIIHNFKTFYRKEVVKIVLDALDKEEPVNISVLSAMLLTDKAWRAVTSNTILNCFKKAGFPFDSQTEDQLEDIAPTHDFHIPTDLDVDMDEFIRVDDEVAVWGPLTDDEIVEQTAEPTNDQTIDNPDGGADDDSEVVEPVSIKEARAAFGKLKMFCLQCNDVDDQDFQALFLLEARIDNEQNAALKQTKITDFFKKSTT